MDRKYLEQHPDLVELSRKVSHEQVRKYKEEQRAKKNATPVGHEAKK